MIANRTRPNSVPLFIGSIFIWAGTAVALTKSTSLSWSGSSAVGLVLAGSAAISAVLVAHRLGSHLDVQQTAPSQSAAQYSTNMDRQETTEFQAATGTQETTEFQEATELQADAQVQETTDLQADGQPDDPVADSPESIDSQPSWKWSDEAG